MSIHVKDLKKVTTHQLQEMKLRGEKISMLTAEDERKFSAALQVLVNSAVDKYAAVITNTNGVVVSQIPNPSGKSLLNSLSENTFWVQPLLTSPDIRFNG